VRRPAGAGALALASSFALALYAVGGSSGLLYLAIFLVAVQPGLPLGFALFGREQPAGWIAGIGIGYALAVISVWAATRLHATSGVGFLVAIAASTLISWVASTQIHSPAVRLPQWTRRATWSFAGVLLVTLALAAPPLANVGAPDEHGNKRYRAYFTADFVWHTALSAELTRFALPPRNPYLASQTIHYYWGYFLVPAAIARTGPPPLRDVERCLKLNALLSGLLLISTIFIASWATVQSPIAAAAGTLLALCSASLEGLYALWRIWSRGAPLSAVRDMNIDALTAWYFSGHRIDGLQRCLWYVPQHSMSYALGLIALIAVIAGASGTSTGGILLAGIALGASTLFNPFVGAIFALIWGAAVAIDALRSRGWTVRLARHSIAGIPILLALAWCIWNRMVEGGTGALELIVGHESRQAPVVVLMLSFGPVLLAAAAGIAVNAAPLRRAAVPAMLLGMVSIFLMYFVRLNVDHEWVPFRAGQMLLASLAVLSSRWFAVPRTWPRRPAVIAAAVLLFLAGLPTTVIDEYNARDITNTNEGPGFKWTLVLSPEQQEAFEWIRRTTARLAVVQMEPEVREREAWSLIPSFAQRAMAAGLPISLLRVPDYRTKSDQVKTMFASADAHEASTIARSLGIRYVYVDETDRRAYAGAAKFDSSPEYFQPMFRRGAVGVYHVR
jgi:hypothetical protein